MPINSSLYAQFAPPVRSVADYQNDLQRNQMNALSIQGAQLDMQAKQESAAQENALSQAVRESGGNATRLREALVSRGNYGAIEKHDKAQADLRLTGAKTESEQAQTTERQASAEVKFIQQRRETAVELARMFGSIDPNDDNALADLYKRGVDSRFITPAQAMQFARQAGEPGTPQRAQFVAQQRAAGLTEVEKITRALELQKHNETVRGHDLTFQASRENNRDTNATSRANNQATVGAALRGQNLTHQRAGEANTIAAGGNIIKTETDLRKEFADLPEVKRYKNALPAYNAIVSAGSRNNPQADINLVYGVAKLYDPDSVVREGEYGTIANSQAIPEWLKGAAQRLVGGGRLTAGTKQQIMVEAKNRIDSYAGEHEGAKKVYGDIATKRGANPDNIFTPVGTTRQPGAGSPAVSGLDMSAIDAELARRAKGGK
jgi:hypothetical protein